jgi:hypothetical protein
MQETRGAFRELAAGAFVAAALVLPLALQLLADGATRAKVQFRTSDTEPARILTVKISKSVCATAAAALSYGDPGDGAYTEINCDN